VDFLLKGKIMATNEEKVKYIFDAREKAEITFTDFSRLTGISRTTLYRWVAGGDISDILRLNMAYIAFAYPIEKACRSGLLPLKSKLKKEHRVEALRKIIKSMATK